MYDDHEEKIKPGRGFSVWFVIRFYKCSLSGLFSIFSFEINAWVALRVRFNGLKAGMINQLCMKFTNKIKLQSDFSLWFL